VPLTSASLRLVESRVRRVERLLGKSAMSAQCVISHERGSFVCELSVHARDHRMLRGAGRDGLLPGAVAAAVERVTAQAMRLKDRWKTRRRSAAPASRATREA